MWGQRGSDLFLGAELLRELGDGHAADVGDAGNWRLHNGLHLTVTINRILSARVGHELKRLNRPVPGFGRSDTTLSAALVASF